MKRITAALAAFFLALTMVSVPSSNMSGVALALDRVQHLTGLNPPSAWMNQEQRDNRIGIGTFEWDALSGANTSYAGNYAGCAASPVTGLYVAVAPVGAVENCAVYQLQAEETTGYGGYPSGVGTFLPADTTQVVLQGLVPAGSSTANIGPMGVGSTSGQSISNLIECKVTTSDTTSQAVNIVSSGGAVTSTNANRDRVDRLSCQDKQSSSATSPTTPTVDSGYVAISVVLVPFGTSTVTTGMISASTGQVFYGFAPLGAAGATAIDTGAEAQTKAGALTVGGQITGTGPIVSNYGGGTTTIQGNFGSTIASNLTVTGPIAAADSSNGTSTYVPPVYSASGGGTASTEHIDLVSCTTSSGTCTVTLSGAAVFASAPLCVAGSGSGSNAGTGTLGTTSIQLNSVASSTAVAAICVGP